MLTYKLYIGSNNQTKELELEKIRGVLYRYYDGYTVEFATGCWKGQEENTAVVTVTSDTPKLKHVINQLKKVLDQEAIAYQKQTPLVFA